MAENGMAVESLKPQSSPALLYPAAPRRALVISLLALIVAGIGSLVWPDRLRDAAGFAWLLALVPPFLLAYYRGWTGAAVGLFAAVSFGAGVSTELLHRQAFRATQLAYADPLTGLGNRRVLEFFFRATGRRSGARDGTVGRDVRSGRLQELQ